MGLAHSIKSIYVVSPICVATAVFGCNGKDNSAAWAQALDASAESNTKPNRDKDAGKDDAGKDDKTSTGNPQTTASADTSQSTGTDSTGGSSASDAGATDGGEPSNDETDNSTNEGQSSTEPAVDSSDDSTEPPATSDDGDCAGYLLCETFEDVADGEIPDGWQSRGSEVGVSSEQAFGGQRSLRIGATPAGQRRIVRDANVLGSAHWGRIYYKVELPVPDDFAHSTLVAFSGTAPVAGPSEFRVIDTIKIGQDTPDVGGKHNWVYNVQPNDGEEFTCGNFFEWEFDGEWHCVEYHVDAGAQTYRFFYEGEELVIDQGDSCGTPDLPDQFDELRVGWNNYQDAPPGFTAYIDNIAFDDQRIGCD